MTVWICLFHLNRLGTNGRGNDESEGVHSRHVRHQARPDRSSEYAGVSRQGRGVHTQHVLQQASQVAPDLQHASAGRSASGQEALAVGAGQQCPHTSEWTGQTRQEVPQTLRQRLRPPEAARCRAPASVFQVRRHSHSSGLVY